jgi:hypothetical protein
MRGRPRLELEALEERMLMNNRMVVPGAAVDFTTTFSNLKDALVTAGLNTGDVIQIEPGSSPGHIVNADIPRVQKLSIQGDPASGVQSIPYFYLDDSVIIDSSRQGFTLKNAEIDISGGTLQFNANGTITGCRIKNDFAGGTAIFLNGTSVAEISHSYIENNNPLNQSNDLLVVLDSVPTGTNNLISDNEFVANTGKQITLLRYESDVAGTNDLVAHNTFIDNTGNATQLFVSPLKGLTIQDNTFTSNDPSDTAIELLPSFQNVQIVDNVISLPNGGGLGARGIAVDSGLPLLSSSMVIANNHIHTGGSGIGIQFFGESPGVNLVATVQGNDLQANFNGVRFEPGAGGSVGSIDLGGGAQGSLGGNDFRADSFAIVVMVPSAAGPIQAQNNIFPFADPTNVIFDHNNDPALATVIATNPQTERDDILGRVAQTGQWWAGVSNGSGFANSPLTTWVPNVTWVDVQTGDFTGTGQTDFVGRILENGQWWVAVPNGTGYKTTLWTTWSPNVTWVNVKVGDFDGFGRDSIIGRAQQSGQWWVAESNGFAFNNSLWGTWSPNVTWMDVNVGDFTGHRYADIAGRVLETGQWWVGQNTGFGFNSSLWTTWSTAVTWADVQVGDFNGDGLADIAGRYLQTGQWWVAQSTGSSFTNNLWTTWSTSLTWVDIKVGYSKGDGKMSIFGRAKELGQWWVAQSTGSSFVNSLFATWSTALTWVDVQIGDFDGKGLSTITGRALEIGQWWATDPYGKTSPWATWSTAANWVDVHMGNFA